MEVMYNNCLSGVFDSLGVGRIICVKGVTGNNFLTKISSISVIMRDNPVGNRSDGGNHLFVYRIAGDARRATC